MVLQNLLKEKKAQIEEEEYYHLSFDSKKESFTEESNIRNLIEGDCNHIKPQKYAGHNSPWREKNETPFNVLDE